MICTACGRSQLRTVAALQDHSCSAREDWARVSELRKKGEIEKAMRVARKLLGVKGEPMDEETKEKLRRWKEEHADQIREKNELERKTRERLHAIMAPREGPLRRKA